MIARWLSNSVELSSVGFQVCVQSLCSTVSTKS